MDNAINILKAVNKLSYMTEYEAPEVSRILIKYMGMGVSFSEAGRRILRQRKEELQQRLRDEVKEINTTYSATKQWNHFLELLSNEIADGDIDNFLSWPVITQTMFVTDAPYLDRERKHIEEIGFSVTDSKVGNPPTDGNFIHQAYHITRFMEETGQDVRDFDYILEFGGGFGGMCRIIRELGFSGDYVIYDLPHFSALQRYYLDSCQVDAKYICSDSSLTSDMRNVQRFVDGKSLFLSTWALSETPLEVRESFEGILPFFDSFLFAYQDTFDGIDNIAYFKKIKRKHREWIEVEHSDRNRYLFGSKR